MPPATPNIEDLARVLTQAIAALAEAIATLAKHSCTGGRTSTPAWVPTVAAPAEAADVSDVEEGTDDTADETAGEATDASEAAAVPAGLSHDELATMLADAVYALNNMLTVVAGHAELGLLAPTQDGSLAALKAIQQAAATAVDTVQDLADIVAQLRGVDGSAAPLAG